MTKGTVKWFNDQKGFGFIPAAIIRLNEAEAFLVIEPLHGSFCHIALLSGTCGMRPHVSGADLFEIWRKVVSPDAGCAARPSRSAEARLLLYGHFPLDGKVTRQE